MSLDVEENESRGAAPYYEAAGRMGGMAMRAFGNLGGVDAAAKIFSLNTIGDRARDDLGVQALMNYDLNSGVNLGNSVVADAVAERQREEKEKQDAKDRAFQNLLDQINRDIAAIGDRIKGLDDKIEAVDALIKLEEIGQIDPTNPAHQKLLIAAGIDPDKWGTITIEELRQRRLDLAKEREAAKAEEKRLKDLRDSAYEATAKADGKTNLDKPSLKSLNDNYRKTHPDYDPKNATPQQAEDIRRMSRQEQILQRPAVIENEGAWFRERVARLEELKGTPEYMETLDKLIDGLSESTKADLLKDKTLSQFAQDGLAIDDFEWKYALAKADRENPDYLENLEMLVGTLDERTKMLLLQQNELPDEIRSIINSQSAPGTKQASLPVQQQ